MKLIETIDNELYYNGINLKDLAERFGTPLKLTFLDVIKQRVKELKDAFDNAIKENKYHGKFIYLNANKANYGKLEIQAALENADGLETSSHYDAVVTGKILKEAKRTGDYLVCNGYKSDDYLNEIIHLHMAGYKVIDIIDSVDEYDRLKKTGLDIEVGLRIHLQSQYPEVPGEVENDRFGLMDNEVDFILDDIKDTKLVLSTIHFHQRGFDYEESPFLVNFDKAFVNYYVKAYELYSTVCNFDMGGGTPLPTSNDFDYYKWANMVIKHLKELCNTYHVSEPNLISENGKYSQKDGTVNIYKVIAKKYTNEYPWHVVDGSLLIALPEMYALGEPINVCPINALGEDKIKAKLAGVTCDCDDVYPIHEKYIELPDTKEDLYIACLGTGSYQNSMNGKGGVHHCLLPEEKDVVIYTKGNKLQSSVRHNLQTPNQLYKMM